MAFNVPALVLKRFAREQRANAVQAEAIVWRALRDRRCEGAKFRRQVAIGNFIVDFVCFEAGLVVEADGSQHAESERDLVRDERLADSGFLTLRFWNNDVLANPDAVALSILDALRRKL